MGLWIFHDLLGGGCLNTPPLLTRLPGNVEKNRKKRSKAHRNYCESTSFIFSRRSILRSLEVIEGQIFPYKDIFPENLRLPQEL